MAETEQVAAPATGNGEAAPPAAGKKARVVEKVEMTDGRIVEFVGKANFYKDVLVAGKPIEDYSLEELSKFSIGDVAIRLDFRNGTTRTYPLNPALGLQYAGHGGKQKYGDELAGGAGEKAGEEPNLDDWAEVTDSLHERLQAGDWRSTRVGGMAGTSILLQALMKFTGRTLEEVRNHIKDWTPDQKKQLKMDPEIKPIVDEIEREKASKSKVDTNALKASLKGLAA